MMAHDPSLFAGGAALHALDDDENVVFAEHLLNCPTCQAELTGFQETAARLGAASGETAPASMRGVVMAMIAVTRQLPPEVRHRESEPRPETAAAVAPEVAPVTSPSVAEPVSNVIDLAARRRRTTRILLAAAVTIAVALAGFSAFFLLKPDADQNAALRDCVETSSDQRPLDATADSEGVSKVTMSASCGAALVQLSDVPALEAGTTYQLWVLAGDQARSVGLMTPDADGTMPDQLAQVHLGDTAIGVTVEPAGGSPAPTNSPVIVVPLAA